MDKDMEKEKYIMYRKLEFELEYLNGICHGKEYYYNGNVSFEGEYINGKRWNGKGYNKNGQYEYE